MNQKNTEFQKRVSYFHEKFHSSIVDEYVINQQYNKMTR